MQRDLRLKALQRLKELSEKFRNMAMRPTMPRTFAALALNERALLITAHRRFFSALKGKFKLLRFIEEVE